MRFSNRPFLQKSTLVAHVNRATSSCFAFILLLFVLLPLAGGPAQAQSARSASEWTPVSTPPAGKTARLSPAQGLQGGLFRLERTVLLANYARILPGEPSEARSRGTEIALPMPDGTLARFIVVEVSVMAPELAAKFPEIKTYAGQGLDDPQASVRLDVSPAGFHAQVLSPRGAVYVDPAYQGDTEHHVSYLKSQYVGGASGWKCLVAAEIAGGTPATTANKAQSGPTLRTYRLAVACTSQYAAYFGGTVANAMAAIVAAVNRVNGLYETELAVRLVLVANNDLIVYTNPAANPYSNDDGELMLAQNQKNLDKVIGSANYDIGHVFSTGGGGVAMLGCVCSSAAKGMGVTGSAAPTGDAFWVDFVAHEMGHQFGAQHTFNSINGSCGGGNRSAEAAYEPGSGVTIMAYAGLCAPDNLQPNSDPFFHGISLDQIQAFLASGNSGCAVLSATGNSAPTVSAGANYTIPASTPFVLTASGSDPLGNPLTYSWEEMDLGDPSALTGTDHGSGPLFRPFAPTASPARSFPKLSSVLAHTNWDQEVLPTTSRVLNFRVTARNHRSGGGGVADASATVTVVSNAGPFEITSPSAGANWSGARVVTWNVAGTAGWPINATGVNIYLSTNSGQTFPFLLASNAPNTGASKVVLPDLASAQARIMVQAAGNIFYNINDMDFTLAPDNAQPVMQSAGTTLVQESGVPANGLIDPHETVTVNWTLENLGGLPTTNLVATLLTTNGVYYPGAAQTYGVIEPGGTATRPFSFIPAGAVGGWVTGVLQLQDGATSLGMVSNRFPLGRIQTNAVVEIFNNTAPITIVDNASAAPYPSSISVSGFSAPVTKVTASIIGLSHTFAQDISILLVGPGGQRVILDGGAGVNSILSGLSLSFDDAAAEHLPLGPVTNGVYLPTDYWPGRVFAAPAPAAPYSTTLGALASTINGVWSLYVEDFSILNSGDIAGGWSLAFTTFTVVTNTCVTFPQPTIRGVSASKKTMRLVWNAMPGPHYQVQYRTNLNTGSWLNLGSPILSTNTAIDFTDTIDASARRFYRVMVSP
jgi:hypothetical protein